MLGENDIELEQAEGIQFQHLTFCQIDLLLVIP